MTATARRGPRPSLTTDQIAAAAIAIADADGLEGVSMARVAAALGVSTMALYRYVAGKDELLALMLDGALADIAAAAPPDDATDHPGSPPGSPPGSAGGVPRWRRHLEHWARWQLDQARRRPWLMPLSARGSSLGPNQTALIEGGLAALADTPLTWDERTAVVGRVSLHVLSEGLLLGAVALRERAAAAGIDPGAGAEHPALVDYGSLLRRHVRPDEHPNLAAALDADAFGGPPGGPDPGDTSLGLQLVLDGVAALVARAEERRAAGTPPVED